MQIKEASSVGVTLTYFDPQKPITLQVDASILMVGLVAALMQDSRPVRFASKSL